MPQPAHHFIQKLPKGYDTAIGELGHNPLYSHLHYLEFPEVGEQA